LKYFFKSSALIVIAFLSVMLTQSSCKENTLINAKVSPADNTVDVKDTSLSVITHTYYDDTAFTGFYLGTSVVQGVGAVEDPFFGIMTGATYFQVLPTTPTGAIYTDMTIDSAALVLPYSGFTYGDTTDQSATQSYQVFYIQDTLNIATTYYSFTSKPIEESAPLSAPYSVNLYHLKDSLSVNGGNFLHGMRIPLNLPALLRHLRPAVDAITGSTTPTPDFLNAFHGVCVKTADSRRSVKTFPYFQLDGDGLTNYSGAGILVYYHKNGSTADTFVQRYYFNPTYCAFYNSVKKSYSRYPVSQLISSTKPNDEIIALQNQPGANIDIIVPGIKSLPKGIINKAELQLSLLPGYNQDVFMAPSRLYPIGISNGTYPSGTAYGLTYNVADRYPTASTSPFLVLDGQSHAVVKNNVLVNTYTIGLPREVMASIAAGNDTLHLHITGTTQGYYGAYHMVAGGGNHPDPAYRAKLFVVYSKLKN